MIITMTITITMMDVSWSFTLFQAGGYAVKVNNNDNNDDNSNNNNVNS